MIKRFFVLICSYFILLPNAYANSYRTISYIKEISKAVKNADQDTLIVFDVDNVISAPSDLIGRPKARPVRRTIFKEYEQKYGKLIIPNNDIMELFKKYNLKALSDDELIKQLEIYKGF